MDLAVSYEPELLRARDQGLKVISVGALVREPLSSIISLPRAKIRTPEGPGGQDRRHRGIDYQEAYLRTILLDAGVDPASVKVRDVGFNLSPALLTKKVDAVLGAFWNYEGTDLRLRSASRAIIRVDEAGVPTYDELVLVANEGALKRDDQQAPGLHRRPRPRHARPRGRPRRGDRRPARRQPRPRPASSSARW